MIMGGVTLAIRPLTFIGSILIARLLDPADFGIVALAMIYLGSVRLIAGLGMDSAIVYSDLSLRSVTFHAFVVAMMASLIIFFFTFANAQWLATILGDPEITPVLRALAFLIILDTSSLVQAGLLRKLIRFGALARAGAIGTITNIVVTIVLAYLGYGVWSLVIGALLQSLVNTIVVWWLTPGWDWLKPVPWDWSVVRSLLRFGFPVTGLQILAYFSSNWDDWIVGRRLGSVSLGFYSKAYDFSNRLIKQLGFNIVSSVMFPTYVKIRDQKERLVRAYTKSVQMMSTLMFPIAAGSFATAPVLIPVVLGEKWLPIVTTFQIFSIFIFTRPISGNTASVFSALGEPESNLKAGLVLTIVLIPMALILLPYGIEGVAVAVVLGEIAGLSYNLFRINKVLPGAALTTFKASSPPLIATLIMMIVVILARSFLAVMWEPNIWTIIILVGLGVLVYMAVAFLLQRDFMKEVFWTGVNALDLQKRFARLGSKVRSVS